VQLQGINPIAYRIPSTDISACLASMRDAKAAGHGMMGMKILGEGKMRNQVEVALRFALQLDCMDCYTIGAANASSKRAWSVCGMCAARCRRCRRRG
jgi:hypothetical protein